jgi:hypothetical protein
MKYTNQIINGKIDIQSLVSDNKYWKPLTILIALLASVFGVVILSGSLPVVMSMDSERYLRLKYYQHQRKQHRLDYVVEVIRSLTEDSSVRELSYSRLIGLIKA